ncbi:MAG: thioredoxin domain-containing protein [Pseudomonadota bacterium]|nr:thioredoxin domain-containing protein [Pseudomonadota bacterium]
MYTIIRTLSKTATFIVAFFAVAYFYFTYKGFVIDETGNIVLKQQTAAAMERHGLVNVLPDNLHLNVSEKFAEGSLGAPLTLYEFSSLGCPHCADFHLDVIPEVKREYVDNGLLRIVFVNFPLDKKSMEAAMLLQCASTDNYHDFLSRLFDRQRFWLLSSDTEPLYGYAAEFGISYNEAESCLHNDAMAQMIISDRQQGLKQLGMTGTPALLFSGRDGNEIIYSATSFKTLKKYLDERLTRLGVKKAQ